MVHNNGEDGELHGVVEEVIAPIDEKGKAVEFVALNTVAGFTTPGTMKLKGAIQGREVVILIDCGATHNFIAHSLSEELKLPCSETTSYGVIMGTRLAVKGKGICCGVVLELPKLTVKEDFLPLELGSLDVVLGMQWLKRMGTMKVDWLALLMTFKKDRWKIQLKGDPSLTQKEVTFKRLSRTWESDDQGFLIELRVMTTMETEQENINAVQFSMLHY